MIPIAKPVLGKEEEKAVIAVLRSGKISQGEVVEKFEDEFAKFCGTKYAIATDNGTSALMVALVSAEIGAGDEVITTPFTFIATANSIVFTGAKPVFVDIDPNTFNIDVKKIEEKITKKTKAILPVHLYGLMADMPAINEIAKKHKLVVIEDAAQAHGADIKGKRAGNWGNAATFSFYPTKNMTTGEGGMITTNDKNLAERAKLFRNQGMKRRYYHDVVGYNFRMTEIAAAIGIEQLKKLDKFNEKRIENADYLTFKMERRSDISTPRAPKGFKHVYHQYTIRSKNREKLLKLLKKSGIGFGIYYPVPVNKQKALKGFTNMVFPESEKSANEVISLPIHPSVSERELSRISKVFLLYG